MRGGESQSVFSTFFPPRECSGNAFLCKETEVGSECPPAQKHGHQPDPFDSGKRACSGGVVSCPFRGSPTNYMLFQMEILLASLDGNKSDLTQENRLACNTALLNVSFQRCSFPLHVIHKVV